MWQALVQDDDVRVPHGKAHENARSIVEDHNGLPKITAAIKGNMHYKYPFRKKMGNLL